MKIRKNRNSESTKRHGHSKQRAGERYDVSLSKSDLVKIGSLIRSNNAKLKGTVRFEARRSLSTTAWVVKYEGTEFRVLYNKVLAQVTTVLPPQKEPRIHIDKPRIKRS